MSKGQHTTNTCARQPPKRKSTSAKSAEAPKPRLSKLARENHITAAEEAEIKEAFQLFAIPSADIDVAGFEDEKEGVIPTTDVRRALM